MISGHGGARVGAGRKRGRVSEAKRSISEAARGFAEAALQVLIEVAQDSSAPASSRVSAAVAILDRGYGKPAAVDVQPNESLNEASQTRCIILPAKEAASVSVRRLQSVSDEDDEVEP